MHDRRTGELNGSLSGSARFTLLLTRYGQHSIFMRLTNLPLRLLAVSLV
jgi:hypothetical protein